MRILQVSTRDVLGGAEGSALNLHREYLRLGHDSWLAVGQKKLTDDRIIRIEPLDRRKTPFRSVLLEWGLRSRGRLSRLLRILARPRAYFDSLRGLEDFYYPGTYAILDKLPTHPHLIHCHNLHGGYFDLRALRVWSATIPVLMDLRDLWLLTGHCAHPFQCTRFQSGCGQCPDLKIPPAVRRDATDVNWARKQRIYASSRLFAVCASNWVAKQIRKSMLNPRNLRVIPNGIDLATFCPGDRQAARQRLGIDEEADVLLFTGCRANQNPFKDYATIESAVQGLGCENRNRPLIFLCLGAEAGNFETGSAKLRFVPFIDSQAVVADYVRASDIYLHASKAETFGKSITEAMACGLPVVATATGGIPEQVHCLFANPDRATGILVSPGNAAEFQEATRRLLARPDERTRLGHNGAVVARANYGLELQAQRFLDYYQEILSCPS